MRALLLARLHVLGCGQQRGELGVAVDLRGPVGGASFGAGQPGPRGAVHPAGLGLRHLLLFCEQNQHSVSHPVWVGFWDPSTHTLWPLSNVYGFISCVFLCYLPLFPNTTMFIIFCTIVGFYLYLYSKLVKPMSLRNVSHLRAAQCHG